MSHRRLPSSGMASSSAVEIGRAGVLMVALTSGDAVYHTTGDQSPRTRFTTSGGATS
jgi:hypothetical protein